MRFDVFLTVAARVLTLLLSLAASVIVGRCLGPEGQGYYAIAIAFTATVAQFANLGLHSSNTYMLARDDSLYGSLVANSIWVSLIVGAGGGCVAASICHLLGSYESDHMVYLWIAALLVPAKLLFLLGSNLLVASRRMNTFNLLQIGNYLLLLGALALVGMVGGRVSAFLLSTLAAAYISGIVLLAILFQGQRCNLTFRGTVFRQGFTYAAKAYIVCVLGFLVLRVNVFLIQGFKGAAEVGQYSVAAQITEGMMMLPASIALVLFPRLIRDDVSRWGQTIRIMLETSVLMFAGCLGAAFLAKPFILLTYGDAYLPAVTILLWLLPGTFFLSLTQIVSQYLAAIGFPKVLIYIWGAIFAMTAILSWLLVPEYGAVGAAAGMSASYAVLFCLQLGLAYRLQNRSACRDWLGTSMQVS